jgi:hypothetical protein
MTSNDLIFHMFLLFIQYLCNALTKSKNSQETMVNRAYYLIPILWILSPSLVSSVLDVLCHNLRVNIMTQFWFANCFIDSYSVVHVAIVTFNEEALGNFQHLHMSTRTADLAAWER